MNTGAVPKPASIAWTAAWTPGLPFTSTSTAGAPWCSMTSTVTPGGQTSLTCSRKSRAIVLGSWSGTSRKLSFAPALQGRTVFGPGPA